MLLGMPSCSSRAVQKPLPAMLNDLFTMPPGLATLERRRGSCHGWPMAGPDSNGPRAGGCLLAASILAGALLGAALGQPSIGLVAGAVVGIASAGLLWLLDRRA